MNHTSDKKAFLPELDYFRGIAIWLIVWCHTYGLVVVNSNSSLIPQTPGNHYAYPLAFEEFLIFGATSFFVFISGFLFHHIFYKRGFDYKKFLISKIKNVFLPYIILCAILAVWKSFHLSGHMNSSFWLKEVFFYHALWYVPFIMFVFLCSPLYIQFIELKPRFSFCVFVVSVIYSCFTIRHNTNPVLSMAFWSSFYLAGILSSKYYRFLKHTSLKLCCFYSCIILTTIILAAYFPNRQIHMGATWNFTFCCNIIVLPKLLYCFVVLFFCQWLAEQHCLEYMKAILHILARYSFSIFFIHVLCIYAITLNLSHITPYLKPLSGVKLQILSLAGTGAICVICIFISWIIKKIAGKYSRSIIGA